MKVRTLSIIVAALAALTLSSCSLGSDGGDASGDTTPATDAPTLGSFTAIRKDCSYNDTKAFDAIVGKLTRKPSTTDKPQTTPFADQLRWILAAEPTLAYVVGVGASADGSCLKAFIPYMPTADASSGGGNGGGGGHHGGSGGGTPVAPQPPVGGQNCANNTIDPDGPGPLGCLPVTPSVVVNNPVPDPTAPAPPAATPTTASVPAATATTVAVPASTQPVVVIDSGGQPVNNTVAPPVATVAPTPGECWIIDGVPQGNCT